MLMGALVRWAQQGAGAAQQQSAGPFALAVDARLTTGHRLGPARSSRSKRRSPGHGAAARSWWTGSLCTARTANTTPAAIFSSRTATGWPAPAGWSTTRSGLSVPAPTVVFMEWTCGYCGNKVAAREVGSSSATGLAAFQCPKCHNFTIRSGGRISPPAQMLPMVEHVPDDVGIAWREAVDSYGAGAYTAAEIMCRKILMHVAVDEAGASEGKSFIEYVDKLDSEGYIAKGLKAKVDEIRQRGNVANHKLPASTAEIALKTLSVTRHLLVSIYELPNS